MSEGTRRSCLQAAKLGARKTNTSRTDIPPSLPASVNKYRRNKSTKALVTQATKVFQPADGQSLQISDHTTPSAITEFIYPEAIRLQQEEISALHSNIFLLNDQVQSLQQSLQTQNSQAAQIQSTIGEIQESIKEQLLYQSSMNEAISKLRDNNSLLKPDIHIIMHLLAKMDTKISHQLPGGLAKQACTSNRRVRSIGGSPPPQKERAQNSTPNIPGNNPSLAYSKEEGTGLPESLPSNNTQ